jgi:hypothetical protein
MRTAPPRHNALFDIESLVSSEAAVSKLESSLGDITELFRRMGRTYGTILITPHCSHLLFMPGSELRFISPLTLLLIGSFLQATVLRSQLPWFPIDFEKLLQWLSPEALKSMEWLDILVRSAPLFIGAAFIAFVLGSIPLSAPPRTAVAKRRFRRSLIWFLTGYWFISFALIEIAGAAETAIVEAAEGEDRFIASIHSLLQSCPAWLVSTFNFYFFMAVPCIATFFASRGLEGARPDTASVPELHPDSARKKSRRLRRFWARARSPVLRAGTSAMSPFLVAITWAGALYLFAIFETVGDSINSTEPTRKINIELVVDSSDSLLTRTLAETQNGKVRVIILLEE